MTGASKPRIGVAESTAADTVLTSGEAMMLPMTGVTKLLIGVAVAVTALTNGEEVTLAITGASKPAGITASTVLTGAAEVTPARAGTSKPAGEVVSRVLTAGEEVTFVTIGEADDVAHTCHHLHHRLDDYSRNAVK